MELDTGPYTGPYTGPCMTYAEMGALLGSSVHLLPFYSCFHIDYPTGIHRKGENMFLVRSQIPSGE